MALSMYASRRLYVKQWWHDGADERYTVRIERGGKPVKGIREDRISFVDVEVQDWFKANHIHAWFVDNVQNGVDDCGSYPITSENLIKLLAVCEEVIEASVLVNGSIEVGEVWNSELNTGEATRKPGRVIDDPKVASELLPTREGAFFGSCEYDGDYLYDVYDTRDWAKRMIEDHKNGVPGELYYHSTW